MRCARNKPVCCYFARCFLGCNLQVRLCIVQLLVFLVPFDDVSPSALWGWGLRVFRRRFLVSAIYLRIEALVAAVFFVGAYVTILRSFLGVGGWVLVLYVQQKHWYPLFRRCMHDVGIMWDTQRGIILPTFSSFPVFL